MNKPNTYCTKGVQIYYLATFCQEIVNIFNKNKTSAIQSRRIVFQTHLYDTLLEIRQDGVCQGDGEGQLNA